MTTRTRKHWTQEDIQKLIALTEEGTSNADIANQLDCTAHSLKNKKHNSEKQESSHHSRQKLSSAQNNSKNPHPHLG